MPDVRKQSRADAGLAPARSRSPVGKSEVRGFTVHHTAGPATQTPAQIQSYHFSIGWADVGYARLVVDHGSYAVIDTYDNVLPSVHALAAVRQCYAEAQSWAGRALPVTSHRDLVSTGARRRLVCLGEGRHGP
ncbi:hypothetical protein [Nocardiopsis metallicus]|uniref:hypothetical protein n=1 Tax=Nocardiopsis metallicus TaxID=179819 RepID=UPI0016075122